MTYKKIKNFLLIIIIIILLDFLLTYFLFSKFNLYNIFYPNFDHRISNDYYHHSFKENVNTTDFWGDFSYNFITNSLGFKDKQNRAVDKKTKLKKRIIINGDSFVEGIGIEYKKTFVGMLDNYLYEKNIEILNAGVSSQSPILYYKKTTRWGRGWGPPEFKILSRFRVEIKYFNFRAAGANFFRIF